MKKTLCMLLLAGALMLLSSCDMWLPRTYIQVDVTGTTTDLISVTFRNSNYMVNTPYSRTFVIPSCTDGSPQRWDLQVTSWFDPVNVQVVVDGVEMLNVSGNWITYGN